jgi:UDPglucose 6-dehydrogenase
VLEAVEAANEVQKRVLARKITDRFGASLRGRRFAIWGLAFKPNTDDMREAPSRALIDELLERGASIVAWDPAAGGIARKLYADRPEFRLASSALEACDGADALVIVTEWKAFRSPDFAELRKRLREPVIFDGRNLYPPLLPEQMGLQYEAIGRRSSIEGEVSS